MTIDQTSKPQPSTSPQAPEPNLPVDSVILAPEDLLEPAPPTTAAPPEIIEWDEDRNYAQHWGINE
jgi:hypothetical protein